MGGKISGFGEKLGGNLGAKTGANFVIKNANLIDFSGEKMGDLAVKNGVIAPLKEVDSSFEIIDFKGEILMPALVDLSQSVADSNAADLAQKGGVGTLICRGGVGDFKESKSSVEILKMADALDSSSRLSELYLAAQKGAAAIYLRSDTDANLALQAALYAKMLGSPLVCFCLDATIAKGSMNAGPMASDMGAPSMLKVAQTKEVAKMREMLSPLGIRAVFVNLAYPRSVEILSDFWDSGAKIAQDSNAKTAESSAKMARDSSAKTAESSAKIAQDASTKTARDTSANSKNLNATKPLSYNLSCVEISRLLLDEGAYANYDSRPKVMPPLLNVSEKENLITLLKSGKIDAITSGYTPFAAHEKDQVFDKAKAGINCLDSYFSLLYTGLVKSGFISLSALSKLCSKSLADAFNLSVGSLEVGKKASIMRVKTAEKFTLKNALSPYDNAQLYGTAELL